MSLKYTDKVLSASAKPEAKIANRRLTKITTGSHGKNGLPAMSKTIARRPISIENCTQACSTLLKTKTSRGKATRRTKPELAEMAPIPRLVMREKKFQGNKAHSKK